MKKKQSEKIFRFDSDGNSGDEDEEEEEEMFVYLKMVSFEKRFLILVDNKKNKVLEKLLLSFCCVLFLFMWCLLVFQILFIGIEIEKKYIFGFIDVYF